MELAGAGLDTGHGHYTVSGPDLQREGRGRRPRQHQYEQGELCRKCDTASPLDPLCARVLHRTWSHPRRCEVAKRGRVRLGIEAGTMLGLMGRGDTAAGRMQDAGRIVRSLGGAR